MESELKKAIAKKKLEKKLKPEPTPTPGFNPERKPASESKDNGIGERDFSMRSRFDEENKLKNDLRISDKGRKGKDNLKEADNYVRPKTTNNNEIAPEGKRFNDVNYALSEDKKYHGKSTGNLERLNWASHEIKDVFDNTSELDEESDKYKTIIYSKFKGDTHNKPYKIEIKDNNNKEQDVKKISPKRTPARVSFDESDDKDSYEYEQSNVFGKGSGERKMGVSGSIIVPKNGKKQGSSVRSDPDTSSIEKAVSSFNKLDVGVNKDLLKKIQALKLKKRFKE